MESVSSFKQSHVKVLKESDFNLSSESKIGLKSQACTIVLFHSQNEESKNLMNIWSEASSAVAGPEFAAVDITFERKIASNFAQLSSDAGNPLKWASLQTIPFILVYHGGWPVSFYNGVHTTQNIVDFSIASCHSDIADHSNPYHGMSIHQARRSPAGSPQRTSRPLVTQFDKPNDLRGYKGASSRLYGTPSGFTSK